ncbi:MAG: hypothetical protein JO134_23430 [Xanthobacteraceae bacterium]|nr:hypothetical protein [Xanthobacteraceae bacterium]
MGTRFYFNTENDHSEIDPDGTELADADLARQEALMMLAEMIRDGKGSSLWKGKPYRVWVSDGPGGSGHVLFSVRVSAVVFGDQGHGGATTAIHKTANEPL